MKKKVLKALVATASLFAIAFSATACTGGGGGEEEPEHEHNYEWVSDGAAGHHQECKEDGDKKPIEAHVFGDDDVCDKCDYKKPTTPPEEDEGLKHTKYIDINGSKWSTKDGVIAYTIVTTANGRANAFTLEISVNKVEDVATISAYKIVVDGSTSGYGDNMSAAAKNLVGKKLADIEAYLAEEAESKKGEDLHTNATLSNTLCFEAAAFALANYDECTKKDKTTYADFVNENASSWSTSKGVVNYNIVTAKNGHANPFTITVSVKLTDNVPTISAYKIVENGSTSNKSGTYYGDSMSSELNNLVGKTLDDINEILAQVKGTEGNTLYTGATQSNTLCFNAAGYALYKYSACLNADKMAYVKLINMETTTWVNGENGAITYNIITTKNGPANPFTFAITVNEVEKVPTISSYSIVENGSTTSKSGTNYGDLMSEQAKTLEGKTLADIVGYLADTKTAENGSVLNTGATRSNTNCYEAAAFALSNYKTCAKEDKLAYSDYINVKATAWTKGEGSVNFNIVTKKNSHANPFTIQLIVEEVDGVAKLSAYGIVVNGSTTRTSNGNVTDYADLMSNTLKNMAGKSLADVLSILADTKTKDEGSELHTGATQSNTLCFQAAVFALANYDYCAKADKAGYPEFIDFASSDWSVSDGEVSYTIVTKANRPANAFTFTIKVKEVEGKVQITAYEITTNGSTSRGDTNYSDLMSEQAKNLVGKTLADIEGYLADAKTKDDGSVLNTGATRSNELCYYAAAFALSNYYAFSATAAE